MIFIHEYACLVYRVILNKRSRNLLALLGDQGNAVSRLVIDNNRDFLPFLNSFQHPVEPILDPLRIHHSFPP